MKKTFITFIALLALLSFGMASSAQAFSVQIPTAVATIFGPVVMAGNASGYGNHFVVGVTTPRAEINDQREVCAPVRDQRWDRANKQAQNFVILPMIVLGGGVPS